MDFFAGHYISITGSIPDHTAWIENTPIYYGIQYNHAGKLRLKINHQAEYTVEGPHAFITHPGTHFAYGPADGKPRFHNFICSFGERIESYIRSGLMELRRDPPLVPIHNPEKFLQTMLAIHALYRRPGLIPPRAILLYEDLLLQMHESSLASRKLPPFQEQFFIRLIDRIRRHPEQEWDFAREARECHVTPTHFRRLFKETAKLPPQQFLIQCRLQHAANLLIATRDSVAEIAERVGINNQFYFSRLFKEKYLTSPLEYRREFLGKNREVLPS